MTAPDYGVRKGVPAQALYISLGALVVPAGAALLVPDILGAQGVLIWLLALTPAFLLAYYKGLAGCGPGARGRDDDAVHHPGHRPTSWG